jgi:NAD(P)-dependent dehydrogenase (short-subunit alcohol dehydrogenase family)
MNERIDQIGLVVGGSGAIGSAIAERLAREGADIAFTFRGSTEKAATLSTSIESVGRQSMSAAVAIEDYAAVEAFVTATLARFGRIDTLVYASGPSFDLDFVANVSPVDWSRVIDADLKGCFSAIHFALPHLRRSKGSIVAITAAAVDRAIARDILSLAPKAAITALVRGVALEEGRFGVRANCVAPGYISAGIGKLIMDRVGKAVAEQLVKTVPLRRMGTVNEVADAAAYLSSARASYITGMTMFVSGGMEL